MKNIDSRKIITAPGFWDDKVTLNNLEKARPIFILETLNTIFKANTLSDVCQLYKNYTDNVPEEIKQHRLEEIMAVQQDISAEINRNKIGQKLKVIIDKKEGDYFVGRTEFDSPEVDPEVLIPTGIKGVKVGNFYNSVIIDSSEFELFGKQIIFI